jgi:hypothetical protein
MLIRGVIIMWAMAATLLPVTPAPAAEAAPGSQSPPMENIEPQAASVPAPAAAESVAHYARPVGLAYTLEAPAPETRFDGLRFDFARRPLPEAPLRTSPAGSPARPGWALSGRAGLLRWLTPIDGEGGTTVRLGGRITDQPRTPGAGVFNLSLHYAFE